MKSLISALKRNLAQGLALTLLASSWPGVATSASAAEFEVTASSFTVDYQVNLSSTVFIQKQTTLPSNPNTNTTWGANSTGGLYYDGTYYRAWDNSTAPGAWVSLTTGTAGGLLPWTSLTNFPAACGGGQYVTAVGGTLTCSTPAGTGVTGSGAINDMAYWTGAGSIGYLPNMGNGGLVIGTGGLPSTGTLTGSGGISVTNAAGTITVGVGAGLFANPTGTIGLSAVNGSATTAMRSDAAPVLSQAITPTWSGAHIFSNTVTHNSVVNFPGSGIWNASGNVGIGTTNPGFNLDVTGDVRASSRYINGTSGARQVQLNSAGADWGTIQNDAANVWSLGYSAANATTLGTPVLSWNGSSNVGIGTTNPQAPLYVSGTVMAGNSGGPNVTTEAFLSSGTTAGYRMSDRVAASNVDWVQYATGGTYRIWNGKNGDQFAIQTGGNVGIGTTNPGQKLEVNGYALADSGVYVANTNTALTQGNGNALRVQTNSGYIDVGPQNTSYAHIYTDRAAFYLNAPLYAGTGNVLLNSSGNSFINAGSVGIGTTNPGEPLDVTGIARASGEIISTMATGSGQFRAINGNYGVFLRNDGSNTYFLTTASGDQYGSWSALRPFYFNNASGNVTMGHSVTVSGALTATSLSNSVYAVYAP